jgi:hypothetical protein
MNQVLKPFQCLGVLLGHQSLPVPSILSFSLRCFCKLPLIEKETPMTPDQMVTLNKDPSWLGDSSIEAGSDRRFFT